VIKRTRKREWGGEREREREKESAREGGRRERDSEGGGERETSCHLFDSWYWFVYGFVYFFLRQYLYEELTDNISPGRPFSDVYEKASADLERELAGEDNF